MFCGKCGSTVPDGYEFCMKCGTKIDLESLTDDSQKTMVLSNQAPSKKKKLSSKKKIVIFGSIVLVFLICFTVGYFALDRDKYYVKFPNNPEIKADIASGISDENQILINNFLQQLVIAFNNRKLSDNGLLLKNDKFEGCFDDLLSNCNTIGEAEKDLLSTALFAYREILKLQINEVKFYDANGLKLEKPIVEESTLIKAKEEIDTALAYYYK